MELLYLGQRKEAEALPGQPLFGARLFFPPRLTLLTDWAWWAVNWYHVTLFPGIQVCSQNTGEEELQDPYPVCPLDMRL